MGKYCKFCGNMVILQNTTSKIWSWMGSSGDNKGVERFAFQIVVFGTRPCDFAKSVAERDRSYVFMAFLCFTSGRAVRNEPKITSAR